MSKDYEAMRAELEASGYREGQNGDWYFRDGFISAYSATFPSIDSAYKHYEEGKRYEAMLSLIQEMNIAANEYRQAGMADRQDFSQFFARLQTLAE